MSDVFELQRFLAAQEPVYAEVCAELRAGCKKSHWMWFVFPQLKGLGHSAMATRYGIGSRAEGEEYLRHAVLGPRLIECTQIVNLVEGRSAAEIFGYPDDLKFHSSMTLFAQLAPPEEAFSKALRRYFGGQMDAVTLERLGSAQL